MVGSMQSSAQLLERRGSLAHGRTHLAEAPFVRVAARPPMSSVAYHRVMNVLEYCDGADSIAGLAQRLVTVLPQMYHCRVASFFTGRTLSTALEDPQPMIVAPPDVDALWCEYQRKWRASDVYASPVAQSELTGKGVAVLRYLDEIPAESKSYVRDFLCAGGIPGSAAMRLSLAGGHIGLVGLFDQDPECFTREDARGLALLAGRLSALTRLMPHRVVDDILVDVNGSCREVALLVGEGMTNAAIGARLCLAEDTVKKYVSRVLAATGCRSRTELALRLQQHAS